MAEPKDETVDYVVVGSGAGGGPLAARLAEAGMSVLVLEAGADPATLRAKGLPEDYRGSRIPSVRLGKSGDCVELPRPQLRRRRRAPARLRRVRAARRPLSARLHARRLHDP